MKLGLTNFKFDRESWEIDFLYDKNIVVKEAGAYKRACDAVRDASYKAEHPTSSILNRKVKSILVCKVSTREVCRFDVTEEGCAK